MPVEYSGGFGGGGTSKQPQQDRFTTWTPTWTVPAPAGPAKGSFTWLPARAEEEEEKRRRGQPMAWQGAQIPQPVSPPPIGNFIPPWPFSTMNQQPDQFRAWWRPGTVLRPQLTLKAQTLPTQPMQWGGTPIVTGLTPPMTSALVPAPQGIRLTPGNASRAQPAPVPADYRQRYADILMTPEEYAKRRGGSLSLLGTLPGYQQYIERARQAASAGQAMYDWQRTNPFFGGALMATDEERARRQNVLPGYERARPTMQEWIPYGSGFRPIQRINWFEPNWTSMGMFGPPASAAPRTRTGTGRRGYYPYFYGGGGGYYPYRSSYEPPAPEWYMEMLNWRI